MNIERGICENLLTVFQAIFPGLDVDCDWLVGRDFMPVHRPRETAKMDIVISPRKHDSFTTRIAEISGMISMTFSVADEADVVRTIDAYDYVVEKLDAWHFDIDEAKKDLAVHEGDQTLFNPVGFMSIGGTINIDREEKKSNFTLEFTIKGRKSS